MAIVLFFPLLLLSPMPTSMQDLDEKLLDQVESTLTPLPGSDDLIAAASLALIEKPAHQAMLLRHRGKPQAFQKYILGMIGKTMEEVDMSKTVEADAMLQDYMERFAVQVYKKGDWWDKLEARFSKQFHGSYVAPFIPAAHDVRKAALTLGTGVGYKQQDIIFNSIKEVWANPKFYFDEIKFMCLSRKDHLADMAKQVQQSNFGRVALRAGAVLSVGFLGWDLYVNVRQWYLGKIDGATAARNVVSTYASISGGIVGSGAGAALGSLAGPVGTVVGGALGGALGSALASEIVKMLFDAFFGSDQERALQNAYKDLKLPRSASLQKVRDQYLELAKDTHPDKGGEEQAFININVAYELIRAERINAKD